MKMRIEFIQNEMSGSQAPESQIRALNSIKVDEFDPKFTRETFERVAFSLKKYGLKWSRVFGENNTGPNAMLKTMRTCFEKIQLTAK